MTSSTSGSSFVDTNVLLYAHDIDAGPKHEIARRLVEDLWSSRRGVISTQVLQEFYVNVTRKIPKPLSRIDARDVVADLGRWKVERLDLGHVRRASEIEEKHRLSFWDALIVAAAASAGTERLLSEDLNDGQRLDGVLVCNPFAGLGTNG